MSDGPSQTERGWDFSGYGNEPAGERGQEVSPPGFGGESASDGWWHSAAGAPSERPSQRGFDMPEPGTASADPKGPPAGWLWVGLAWTLVPITLGLLATGRPLVAFAGWTAASLGCVGLVVAFTLLDVRRRADPWYVERREAEWLRLAVLVFGACAVAVNALRFADWVSRR